MPHQHNLPNTQLSTPTHPISPTRPSLACQPNYLWACLLMLDKSCSTPSSEFPSASPPVSTLPHSPVIEAAPSLHWPLYKDSSVPHTNKTHSYIFIKTHTHTNTFIALQVSLRHSERQCFFSSSAVVMSWIKRPSVIELPCAVRCGRSPEPADQSHSNLFFVEPPIYLVSLWLPHCQLQLFWFWKHIQKWLQH